MLLEITNLTDAAMAAHQQPCTPIESAMTPSISEDDVPISQTVPLSLDRLTGVRLHVFKF